MFGFELRAPAVLWATLCDIQIGAVETPGHWVMWVGGWGFRRPFCFGFPPRRKKEAAHCQFPHFVIYPTLHAWQYVTDLACVQPGMNSRAQKVKLPHPTCWQLVKKKRSEQEWGCISVPEWDPDTWIHANKEQRGRHVNKLNMITEYYHWFVPKTGKLG